MTNHRKQVETLRTRRDTASSVFCTWAIANGYGQVVRNQLEGAITQPEGLKLLAADRATQAAFENAENEAVHAGAAWRGSYGMVNFYTSAEMRKFSRQGA